MRNSWSSLGAFALERPRQGYKRAYRAAREEGYQVNLKRIYRLWRNAGLNVVLRPIFELTTGRSSSPTLSFRGAPRWE